MLTRATLWELLKSTLISLLTLIIQGWRFPEGLIQLCFQASIHVLKLFISVSKGLVFFVKIFDEFDLLLDHLFICDDDILYFLASCTSFYTNSIFHLVLVLYYIS